MALSFQLQGKGYTADELNTVATVTLEKEGEGFSVTGITLDLTGKVPGIDQNEFEELAKGAKENCPISKALSAVPISLNIKFSA